MIYGQLNHMPSEEFLMAGLLMSRYFTEGKTPPSHQVRSIVYQPRLWLGLALLLVACSRQVGCMNSRCR